MWFDTHAHLYYLKERTVENAVQEAQKHHVNAMVVPGVDRESNLQALACVQKYHFLWAGLGFHPNDCYDLTEEDWSMLAKQIRSPKVVAIGETGLDYYRSQDNAMMALQHEAFDRHIQLAKSYKMPLIVHTRSAKKDTLEWLEKCYHDSVRGILHCFSEDLEMAMKAIDLGFYVSFSGIITFKNAHDLREVVKNCPKDRVLIETDCPYLAPAPYRGKENQPAWTYLVGEMVAALWGMPIAEVLQQLWQNSHNIFQLPLP